MSVDAKAGATIVPAGDGASGAGRGDVAGLLFARLSVVPALLAMAWLLSGFAFLCAGWFRPLPVTVGAVVLAVPLVWFGVRVVPGLPGRSAAALPERGSGAGGPVRTPWWPLAAVAVIAVGFFAQQVYYHSQFVIITRDPGAYFQFATWLAAHGSLPIPQDAAAFGGTHGGAVTFASYAMYQVGGSVVPQFMAGLPMVLAGAMWAGGFHAALLMAPLLGSLAVVTFAGLAARLVGARWAPLAALVVAVSLPMQFTSRSTYSEPLAEILFLGGLALVVDALRAGQAGGGVRGARVAAGLGGLALGVMILVRIDGASDVLPVIPFCGALFVRRRPQALPLAAGLAVGAACGVGEGLVFSWPYLMQTNRASVIPLAAITVVVIAGTVAGVWFFRRRPLPRWWPWLPNAALAAAFVVIFAFGIRPYFQHPREANNAGKVVRTYAEISLHWVDWYLGIPVIIAATVGAGLLARKCLRGRAGDWVLPLMVLSWATVTFLYRPAITPDQPWASRRMVPEVVPAFVLLAMWAVARGSAWLGERRLAASGSASAGRPAGLGTAVLRAPVWRLAVLRPAAVAVCVIAVVLPAAITNWGLGVSTSGGIKLTADGMGNKRDFQGELDAMQRLCAALPANASVIFTDPIEAPQMLQDIRGICNVPTAEVAAWNGAGKRIMSDAHLAVVVKSVVASVEQAGRVPVVLAAKQSDLNAYRGTGTVRHVFTLYTTRDPDAIHSAPKIPVKQTFDVWMWRPSG
jgi:hypothetical protein